MPEHTTFTFADRHIGPDSDDLATMLGVIGVASLDELAAKALPAGILDALGADGLAPGLDRLPAAVGEHEALAELRAMADANTVAVSMIGQGYYDTLTPPVLLRNILENPAWYTAYTPYQPEISQGRLEALLNFQTMISDLTGLEVANASMLDEGTAAAEAMTLMHRAVRGSANRLAVDSDLFAQTAAILATRAEPLGIEIVTADLRNGLPDGEFFGVIAQLPGASGRVTDWSKLVEQAHERGALIAVGADLLALTLVAPPGEIGADVAFGTAQRFGVPMGFGGPHAGYLAVHSVEKSFGTRKIVRGVSIYLRRGEPATLEPHCCQHVQEARGSVLLVGCREHRPAARTEPQRQVLADHPDPYRFREEVAHDQDGRLLVWSGAGVSFGSAFLKCHGRPIVDCVPLTAQFTDCGSAMADGGALTHVDARCAGPPSWAQKLR